MAFELAEIDPTSVPINLLNPRPGTKFGDREYMDPWEAVKWIAIFRLILPDALFRLCGGRVENIAELQRLAVKAGINGVMMGNFLTTLGNTPEEDRAMFEELGLNVARQADNGANPRPDNRTRLAGGRDARRRREYLDTRADADDAGIEVQLWDPSTQLRFAPRSDGPAAPRRRAQPLAAAEHAADDREASRLDRDPRATGRAQGARPAPAHAHGQRPAGPARGPRRQAGAAAVLEQLPRARRPPARARGRGRRGDALGRRRGRLAPRLGDDDDPPPPRGAPGARSRAPRRRCCSARATWRTSASSARWRAAARSSSPTSSTTPRSSTAAGCRARETFVYATPTSTTSPGACARPTGAAR